MTDQEHADELSSFIQAVGKPPLPGTRWDKAEREQLTRWIAAGEGRREWLGLPAAPPSAEPGVEEGE